MDNEEWTDTQHTHPRIPMWIRWFKVTLVGGQRTRTKCRYLKCIVLRCIESIFGKWSSVWPTPIGRDPGLELTSTWYGCEKMMRTMKPRHETGR